MHISIQENDQKMVLKFTEIHKPAVESTVALCFYGL